MNTKFIVLFLTSSFLFGCSYSEETVMSDPQPVEIPAMKNDLRCNESDNEKCREAINSIIGSGFNN